MFIWLVFELCSKTVFHNNQLSATGPKYIAVANAITVEWTYITTILKNFLKGLSTLVSSHFLIYHKTPTEILSSV